MQKRINHLPFLFFFTLSIFSCGSEDCTVPTLAENIIGSWEVALNKSTVEFKTDGTLIDPTEILISGEINGTILDEKSYEVEDASTLTVRASKGSQFVEVSYQVIKNECNEITLEVLGFATDLRRG